MNTADAPCEVVRLLKLPPPLREDEDAMLDAAIAVLMEQLEIELGWQPYPVSPAMRQDMIDTLRKAMNEKWNLNDSIAAGLRVGMKHPPERQNSKIR
jgi:hypothetical protein